MGAIRIGLMKIMSNQIQATSMTYISPSSLSDISEHVEGVFTLVQYRSEFWI